MQVNLVNCFILVLIFHYNYHDFTTLNYIKKLNTYILIIKIIQLSFQENFTQVRVIYNIKIKYIKI